MKKSIIREALSFLVILVVAAIICTVAGAVICALWSVKAGVAVFIFGTILMLAVLGAFD